MTTTGWIFMIVSITFVISLVGWCFKQVLSGEAASSRFLWDRG